MLFKDILPPQYILADNRALLLKITSFTVVRAFPYVKTSFSFPPSLSPFLPLPLRGGIPVYWGRMRMGFRRSGVRSSVLSNLGTNRSCDRLKIHTDCALILIFLFLPSLRAFHARQRHDAPFRDYKKLPRTLFALLPFTRSRRSSFLAKKTLFDRSPCSHRGGGGVPSPGRRVHLITSSGVKNGFWK